MYEYNQIHYSGYFTFSRWNILKVGVLALCLLSKKVYYPQGTLDKLGKTRYQRCLSILVAQLLGDCICEWVACPQIPVVELRTGWGRFDSST